MLRRTRKDLIGCMFNLWLVLVFSLCAIGLIGVIQGCGHTDFKPCWQSYQPPGDGQACGSCRLESTVCLYDSDGTETVENIERLMSLGYIIYESRSASVCFALPLDRRDYRGPDEYCSEKQAKIE